MGKSKKGFNWKARQNVHTDIDNSSTAKVCRSTTFSCTIANLNLVSVVTDFVSHDIFILSD